MEDIAGLELKCIMGYSIARKLNIGNMKTKRPYNPYASRLGRRGRIVFMAALFAVYAIIAPIVIFYGAGYRYDFAEGTVSKTGIVSIDVLPADADVRLGGAKFAKGMPLRLKNRAPGTYRLTIAKDGYHEFIKDIVVESGKTTYIKETSLLKRAEPKIILEQNSIGKDAALTQGGGTPALVWTEPSISGYDIRIWNTGTAAASTVAAAGKNTPPSIILSPFTAHAALAFFDEESPTVRLIDITQSKILRSVSLPELRKDFAYQWSQEASAALYIQSGDTIYSLSGAGLKKVHTYSGKVWFVSENGELWTYENRRLYRYSPSEKLVHAFPETAEIEQIIDINPLRIIAQAQDGARILQMEGDRVAGTASIPTFHAYYHETTREWSLWSWWELWTAYDDGAIALLNRSGDKVEMVRPIDELGVRLLATEKGLIGFNPGYYVSNFLLSADSITSAASDTKKRRIYFLGTYGGRQGLFELEY